MTDSNRTNHTIASSAHDPTPDHGADATADDQEALSREAITQRIAAAPTAAERRRWQVVGLLADGRSIAEVAVTTGYRVRTIREIVARYQRGGAAALEDRRAHSRGAPMLLSPQLRAELEHVLRNSPPDGGTWTGPKVARWIAARTGKPIHRQRGWDYLRRSGETVRATTDDTALI